MKIVREISITGYEGKELVIGNIDRRWIAFGLKLGSATVGLS